MPTVLSPVVRCNTGNALSYDRVTNSLVFGDGSMSSRLVGTEVLSQQSTTGTLCFFGAPPAARPAAPVLLADVITVLQTLGLVAP